MEKPKARRLKAFNPTKMNKEQKDGYRNAGDKAAASPGEYKVVITELLKQGIKELGKSCKQHGRAGVKGRYDMWRYFLEANLGHCDSCSWVNVISLLGKVL